MAHKNMNSAARSADQIANDALDLSASIASRICHDLVSPMGAISNGLELLQLSQQQGGPEFDLITQSVESATSRLRFYRIAMGRVSADQKMGRAEILSILTAMEKHQKQKCQWNSALDLSRRQVKLVFLMLMCLETALPWGGRIEISDTASGLELRTISDRFKINDELWARFEQPVNFAELSSAQIHFGLASAEVRKQQATYTMTQNSTGLCIRIDFT
ncbi:MAG: histidine phosphotransferase [Rhodobacteraceae bacterium]|nr:MAG: histidine phosphotransferase [Paracoccaceae bacterium]